MSRRLVGLRVGCEQLGCRLRVVLKGENGLSPNEMGQRRSAYMRGARHAARAFTSAVQVIWSDTEERRRETGVVGV